MYHFISICNVHNELSSIMEYIIGKDIYNFYVKEDYEFFKHIYTMMLDYNKEGFLMLLPIELKVVTNDLHIDYISNSRADKLYDMFHYLLRIYVPNNFNNYLSILEYKIMDNRVVTLLLKEEVI